MKRYFGFIKGNWIFALLSPIFVLIDVYLEMELVEITGRIIDAVKDLEYNSAPEISYLRSQILLMLAYSFTVLFLGFLAARCASIASLGFTANMRTAIFNKVQDFSFENLDKFSTSSLITRIINDTSTIQMVFTTALNYFIRAPFTLVFALIKALNISRDLSKSFIFVIPSILIVLTTLGFMVVPKFKDMLEKTDKLNKTLTCIVALFHSSNSVFEPNCSLYLNILGFENAKFSNFSTFSNGSYGGFLTNAKRFM